MAAQHDLNLNPRSSILCKAMQLLSNPFDLRSNSIHIDISRFKIVNSAFDISHYDMITGKSRYR